MGKGVSLRREKPVRNWPDYNAGLKRRFEVSLWLDESVFTLPEASGKRGRPLCYHDGLIEMLLNLRCLYHLTLRGTEGFAGSLLRLAGLDEQQIPDYSTLSRRSANLEPVKEVASRSHRIHLVVDSTGLKVYGEGEWKTRQHGVSKRRTWRKLHLGVDEQTGKILADDLTENSTGDQEHLPALLEQIDEEKTPLRQVSVDGIYDSYDCYDAATKKGAQLICPPRKNAVPKQTSNHPRHQAIQKCQEKGRKRWKKETGYHRRSLSETAMFRFKNTFTDKLKARNLKNQKTEARIKVNILNIFNDIAWPAYA